MICEFLAWTFLFNFFCSYHCRLPNSTTVLSNGASMNSSHPCVRYTCNKGNLTIQRCTWKGYKNCLTAEAANSVFPVCCSPPVCS
uniref:8.9 kDa family member n=1 Tax=Rhipicephalus appendiculatus TaxID=34631 RepID=A0A131YT03_RHIAP